MRKILISRTDRIGDLVLTIPLATSLKKALKDVQISFLVRKYQAPLLYHHPDVDGILVIEEDPWEKFREFHVFIDVFPRLLTAFHAFKSRIPVRIGTMYRYWSFLYNRRVKVHRRPSLLHEYIYNFKLLEPLGEFEVVKPRLYLSDDEIEYARRLLNGLKSPVVALHPHEGGTGPDVEFEVYVKISEFLKKKGVSVIHVGQKKMPDLNVLRDFGGETDLRTLMAILSEIDLLISPSTGPMHIANALETPTFSFFKGTGASRPSRWGPLYPLSRVFIGDYDYESRILKVDVSQVLKDLDTMLSDLKY